jgi:hypothetical protein
MLIASLGFAAPVGRVKNISGCTAEEIKAL